MYDSDSNVYFDLGGGMKINFTEQIALKLEALYMLKNDDSSWNSNIALLAGVVFRFGEKAQKVPDQATTTSDDEAEAARKAAEEAEAKRAAEEARKAEEARRAAAAASAAAAAAAAVDSDGDGVADQKDSCDNTGFDVEVDIHGCPLEIKQAIAEFKFNSAVIDQSKKGNIKELVTSLKNNPSYRVSINGHADDIGSDKNNMIISEKRAEAGKELLVENGIDESRITTIGNGRMEPAVKAETEEARAANRRIEFTLYQ
jgi:OOP family OmpA-OmpF porin